MFNIASDVLFSLWPLNSTSGEGLIVIRLPQGGGLIDAWFVGFYSPVGIQNVHESPLSWDNPEETLHNA